ncbi:hypothetical protein LCGC14_1520420 [marine sediment metagenome]|uniref:Uncharacterized protein n=1 Tax=marine sediment metagenome TaxID=412755 RepID=A0A0F9LEE5_9ZZZZ
MSVKKKLKIPYKNLREGYFRDAEKYIDVKCREILTYLSSDLYTLNSDYEERAIKLALACEEFIR